MCTHSAFIVPFHLLIARLVNKRRIASYVIFALRSKTSCGAGFMGTDDAFHCYQYYQKRDEGG